MYKLRGNTEGKINIDHILDGLSVLCDSKEKDREDEFATRLRSEPIKNRSRNVCSGTDTRDNNSGTVINIKLPNITTNITLGSSSRRRDYEEQERLEDKAWRNFYAANS